MLANDRFRLGGWDSYYSLANIKEKLSSMKSSRSFPEWHSDLQRGEILVHITINELVTMFDVFKARVEIPVPPAAHFLGFVELKVNKRMLRKWTNF